MEEYRGELFGWFETGTEGIVWAIQEDNRKGYDGLVTIKEGDHLTVYKEDGSVAFDGVIDPDYEVGWKEYSRNPGHGQPSALGYWIHWTQKNWRPDNWAKLFLRSKKKKEKSLRGVLRRKNRLPLPRDYT